LRGGDIDSNSALKMAKPPAKTKTTRRDEWFLFEAESEFDAVQCQPP
jgi:hypothetical protein